MQGARVLIVDDEDRMRDLVRLYLERQGFTVEEAADGESGLEQAATGRFDLVLLDLMLPGLDGWQVCQRLRAAGQRVPVVMLTARGETDDRIAGLELGADDYIAKPFDLGELTARIRAVLRRAGEAPRGGVLERGPLHIDLGARIATVHGRAVVLTPKEFDLLVALAQRPGQVFSRDLLLSQVWGWEFVGETRTVDAHVKNLREKLRSLDPDYNPIATVWGVGYKFEHP